MKTLKLSLAVVALICSALCSAMAASKIQKVNQTLVGIPYSLEYIAAHSPTGKAKSYFDSNIIFKEYAATYTVYRTYDWQVTFYQNGSQIASFATNDSFNNWVSYTPADEQWLGTTCTVPPGTYTVVVQDISGVGGTYDVGVNFTDANGYGDSSYKWDWISSRSDAVLENVYVDGVNGLEVYVGKTQF